MKINKTASSGSMESSDIMITVSPAKEKGIIIELVSDVEELFGSKIKKVIRDTIKEFEIENIKVMANDKGALDYAIRARTKTAILRALKECSLNE